MRFGRVEPHRVLVCQRACDISGYRPQQGARHRGHQARHGLVESVRACDRRCKDQCSDRLQRVVGSLSPRSDLRGLLPCDELRASPRAIGVRCDVPGFREQLGARKQNGNGRLRPRPPDESAQSALAKSRRVFDDPVGNAVVIEGPPGALRPRRDVQRDERRRRGHGPHCSNPHCSNRIAATSRPAIVPANGSGEGICSCAMSCHCQACSFGRGRSRAGSVGE